MPAGLEDRYVVVDDLTVRYRRTGSGPVVLLLHGSTSSLEHFDGSVKRLAKHFDVIRVDLPGFGLTGPRRDRDYRIQTYARTVARVMRRLDVNSYAVIGNSLGGNIAWNLALDQPREIDALVLVNATGYPEKELPAGMRLARNPLVGPLLRVFMPRAFVERGLRQSVGPASSLIDDAMVDRVHRLWNRPGNRSAFIDFVTTDQVDRSGSVGLITAPTLVVRSASVDGQHFARDIVESREVVHLDGGHLLPEEEPEWFASVVEEFLGDVLLTGER